jgi:ubiquinone biosynthesis protein
VGRYLQGEVGQLDIVGTITSGLNLVHINKLSLPSELAMLLRTVLLLQGLGRQVGAETGLGELIQPYLKEALVKRLDPRTAVTRGLKSAKIWNRLLQTLPEDLRDLRAQLRDGNLTIDFQLHDADEKVDHLVDGLLASAAVLAASQLLSRQTKPLIGPVSVPGAIAVTVGVTTWRRLRGKRTDYVSVGSRLTQLVRNLRS